MYDPFRSDELLAGMENLRKLIQWISDAINEEDTKFQGKKSLKVKKLIMGKNNKQ